MSAGRPQGGHRVKLVLEPERMGALVRVVCEEPEGADCRLACEAVDSCYCWEGAKPDATHRVVDCGECLAVQWMDGEAGRDHAELYSGGKREAVPGLVVVAWDGDEWTWNYPDDKERTL